MAEKRKVKSEGRWSKGESRRKTAILNMIHEFKKILQASRQALLQNQKMVLGTLVAVNGSSYRGAGVRMLVLENNQLVGAISGGCVEKEVLLQAQSVFKNGIPKIMTYDGRFRLGCEGTLYVLLELFSPSIQTLNVLENQLLGRKYFELISLANPLEEIPPKGTFVRLADGQKFSFSEKKWWEENEQTSIVFKEKLQPCFRLVIFGSEHDAASLSKISSAMGWEICVVVSPNSSKEINDFPGASKIVKVAPENFSLPNIDSQTAFVLMNHNFAKDQLYLKSLKNTQPIYIGLLGPAKRKEQLISAYIEEHFEVTDAFLNCIYGPAGLNIGAETPEEIAISIVSEILAVIRTKKVFHLQDKKGSIHEREMI